MLFASDHCVAAARGARQRATGQSWRRSGGSGPNPRSEFVRELTREELREGAIQGMVKSAGDPYTVWIPRDRDEFVKEVQGTFAGIGVFVSSDPRGALVDPLDDSPALEAGVQAGDLIVAVGHEDLTGMAAF